MESISFNCISQKLQAQIMRNLVLSLLIIHLSIADIQLQNGGSTQIYNIEFYLQGVYASGCTDSINNVQIWNNQQNTWIKYSYQYLNTGNGDKYGFSCNDVAGCQFNLPVSILLSTVQGNPITLTNIISTYNNGDIFTTSCQLCRGTQTCYATNTTPRPTPKPTPNPTPNPTSPTKSPTNPTYSPTVPPSNSPTLTPTYLNITTSVAPARHDKVTYVDILYTLLTILIILIVSAIFILTCYRFYMRQSNIQILKPIQYTALIAMFSFICSYFSWLISIYNSHKIFSVIEYLTFAIGWLCLYLFMFYKLYHTFKDSVYKMSKTHICFHVIVAIFIPIWYCILFANKRMNTEIHVYLFLSAVGSILTLIGLLLLIISFNKNLFDVISLQDVIKSRNNNIGGMFESDNEDEYQSELVDTNNISSLLSVITKQTLLGSIMIIDMIIFVMLILILIMAKSDRNDIEWIMYEWCLGLVIIINCLCVFLGFKINEKQYVLLFKQCHNKLLSSYRLLAMKAQRKTDYLLQSDQSHLPAASELTSNFDFANFN
eukprot:141467_1